MTNSRLEPDFVTHEQIDGAAKWFIGVFGAGLGGWIVRNVVRGVWSAHTASVHKTEPAIDLMTKVNDVAERWVERMGLKVQELEDQVTMLQGELKSLREELLRAVAIEADNDVLRRLVADLQIENKRQRDEIAGLKAVQGA